MTNILEARSGTALRLVDPRDLEAFGRCLDHRWESHQICWAFVERKPILVEGGSLDQPRGSNKRRRQELSQCHPQARVTPKANPALMATNNRTYFFSQKQGAEFARLGSAVRVASTGTSCATS